jgi:hypothetical protein
MTVASKEENWKDGQRVKEKIYFLHEI